MVNQKVRILNLSIVTGHHNSTSLLAGVLRSKRKRIVSQRLQEIMENSDSIRKCADVSCDNIVNEDDALHCSSVGCNLIVRFDFAQCYISIAVTMFTD